MLTKEQYQLIHEIVQRAQKMGICVRAIGTAFMDMECAAQTFNLRLKEMLNADETNFIHDFVGIANHINRLTGRFTEGFVPRFAGK